MAIEDDLRAAQARLSQARASRARDEVEESNSLAAVAKVKEELKEFGIVTSEDLKNVREALETKLAGEVRTIEEQLAAAGA